MPPWVSQNEVISANHVLCFESFLSFGSLMRARSTRMHLILDLSQNISLDNIIQISNAKEASNSRVCHSNPVQLLCTSVQVKHILKCDTFNVSKLLFEL